MSSLVGKGGAGPFDSTALESLLSASVAMGLLFISVAVYDETDNYIRFAALAASGACATLAFIAALRQKRSRADVLAICSFSYFAWAGIQEFTQSDALHALPNLLAAMVSIGATRAGLDGVLSGLRRWVPIVVALLLLPALVGHGFGLGRVWFAFLPGRYFGFSNPDALGFVAGMCVLLSIPILRTARGALLMSLGALLLLLTSTNTTAVAVLVGIAVYCIATSSRMRRSLQLLTGALAAATIGALAWMPIDRAITLFGAFQNQFSLSRRTVIWLELLEQTRGAGHFWTGLGDQTIASYTREIMGVGSAHTTILQMFLSKGFLTTSLFVLVAAAATIRTLGTRSTSADAQSRGAASIAAYWFVTSLASIQPGTALGFLVLILVAISRSKMVVDDTPGVPIGTHPARNRDAATAINRPARIGS
jgi:O-antigen ligase